MATFDKFRSVYTHDELMERLRGIRHVALDMDGTIYMGMSLFPYTKPFLEGLKELGIGYSFLTNNPSKSIADYLHKLETLGIHATREEMYTTALATIDYIKQHYPAAKRLFLLGTPSMISEFEAAGFESAADSADDVPDVIVAAFDMTLQYDRLCRAAWWVSQGVPYIATNPDRVCPTDQPTVLVDCGSICACIGHATGRRPDITLGKPDPNMLSGILHPDRRTIKDVIAGFSKIGVEALAVVAGGEGMLRLILDLGIEAHRLHRGHHTGQPHHIRVIGVADGLELHTGANEPLQLGKALESDRLSLLF